MEGIMVAEALVHMHAQPYGLSWIIWNLGLGLDLDLDLDLGPTLNIVLDQNFLKWDLIL